MAPPNRGSPEGPHIIGTLVPVGGAVTTSIADIGTLGHFTFSTGHGPDALRGEHSIGHEYVSETDATPTGSHRRAQCHGPHGVAASVLAAATTFLQLRQHLVE